MTDRVLLRGGGLVTDEALNSGPPQFRPDLDCVLLVHGTFARDAEWVSADSPLAEKIGVAFPGAAVKSFFWSGVNSHEARLSAGRDLAERLADLASKAPGRLVHLVTHSHGGNVALYALRSDAAAAVVGSITFLGTPFFHVIPRNVRRMAKVGGNLLSWTVVPLLLIVMGAGIGVAETVPAISAPMLIGTFVVMVPVFAAYGWYFRFKLRRWLRRRLERWLLAEQAEGLAWLAQPQPTCPVFVGTVAADEAALHLMTIHAATSLPWLLVRIARRTILWVYGCGLVAAIIADEMAEGRGGNDSLLDPVVYPFFSLLVALGLILFIVPPLAAVMSAALRGSGIAFGGESVVHQLTMRVTPAIDLPWAARGGDLIRRFSTSKGNERWRHNSLYGDHLVLQTLFAWWRGELSDPPALGGQRRRSPLLAALPALVGTLIAVAMVAGASIYMDELSRPQKEVRTAPWMSGAASPLVRYRVAEIAALQVESGATWQREVGAFPPTGNEQCASAGRLSFSHFGGGVQAYSPTVVRIGLEDHQGREILLEQYSSDGLDVDFQRPIKDQVDLRDGVKIEVTNHASQPLVVNGHIDLICEPSDAR